MEIELSKMLGNTYENLLKDPVFLGAIGGNVPEKVHKEDNRFYIESPSQGIYFAFRSEDRVLKFIGLNADSSKILDFGLTAEMSQKEIRSKLGLPLESMPTKKMPVLGLVGGWDSYVIDNCKVILMYSADTNHLDELRLIE